MKRMIKQFGIELDLNKSGLIYNLSVSISDNPQMTSNGVKGF